MRTVTFTKIREDGGWLHEIEFELDNGDHVLITDDTDSVTILATKPDTKPINELAKIWRDFGFGTSQFPRRPVEHGLLQSENDSLTLVWEGTGVALSHLI